MQCIIEIVVINDREQQLEHLAGIAVSELGLAIGTIIKQPTRTLYDHAVEPDERPDSVLQLAFSELPVELTHDDARRLERAIEGGKTKKDKRCRTRVLIARRGEAA